jgi:peroxiredoxin
LYPIKNNIRFMWMKHFLIIVISLLNINLNGQTRNKDSLKELINKYTKVIADIHKEIIKAYGVWGKKSILGKSFDGTLRTTFIIDKAGKIEKIISKVDTGNNSGQILLAINSLQDSNHKPL